MYRAQTASIDCAPDEEGFAPAKNSNAENLSCGAAGPAHSATGGLAGGGSLVLRSRNPDVIVANNFVWSPRVEFGQAINAPQNGVEFGSGGLVLCFLFGAGGHVSSLIST